MKPTRIVRAGALAAAAWLAGGGAAPAAARAEGPAGKALDEWFKGAVVGLEGSKVRLRYDFSSAEQWKDWAEGVPWPIAKDPGDRSGIAEGRLFARGSTGARHAAEWEGDLKVTCRLIPDGTKDIGSFLSTADSATDYLAFSVVETYFHEWDQKAGGGVGMMKFASAFSDFKTGGYNGFRYMAERMPKEPPKPGKPIGYAFGRKGGNAFLVAGDVDLEGKEVGNPMRHVWFGFYAIKSAVAVDDVTVEGSLSARWLAEKQVELRTTKPIVPEAAPVESVDPAVLAAVGHYKAGKAGAAKLVDLVKDLSRPEADRKAAAEALKTGPRTAVMTVIDLLYDPEEKVRVAGIDVVKGLLAKTYGYEPKSGEKARSAAIKRLRKDLEDHPELLKGNGAGGG